VSDFEYIKIENFSIPKDNIKEVKIQPTNSKVVFGISVTDKAVSIPDIGWLVFKIYKEPKSVREKNSIEDTPQHSKKCVPKEASKQKFGAVQVYI
jgi:hypothetical protein